MIEITDKSAWILKANQIESQHVSDYRIRKKKPLLFPIKPMRKVALMLKQTKSYRLTIRAVDFRSKNSLRELILTNFFFYSNRRLFIFGCEDLMVSCQYKNFREMCHVLVCWIENSRSTVSATVPPPRACHSAPIHRRVSREPGNSREF